VTADDLVITWRGVELHRVADLEGWRLSRYKLLDEYAPALSACQWRTPPDAATVARIHCECGFWVATWGSYGSQMRSTLEEAMEECDAYCRKRAAEHLAAAEKLLRGLETPPNVACTSATP
jgi:hypothetical protein